MKKLTGNHYYGACDGFHFSDNYVTGDNIYLRELQNFFFEVLGMMSITHYGAIGDGRTDNYGPIQVAIDDANRRGLNYLYVPYGRFIYTGELINIGDIKFVGNPKSKIVNIRTGEEIEIRQFGVDVLEYLENYYTKTQTNTLLNQHYTKEEADSLLAEKQNKLLAGNNIEIVNDTISAIGSQNCMTATGGAFTPTSANPLVYDTIPLTSSVTSGGFELSNNGIVVGQDTNYALISARIGCTIASGNTRTFEIRKGTTAVFATTLDNQSEGSVDEFVVVPPMLIQVEEDDVLTVQTVGTASGDEIDRLYLTVQSAGRDGSQTGVLFTTSIAPTVWSNSTTGTDTGTNEYGGWTITTDGKVYNNSKIARGFDGDSDTEFRFLTPNDTAKEVILELPAGVSIRPMKMHIKIGAKHTGGQNVIIYGYNPNTSAWESLGQIQWETTQANTSDAEYNITTSSYFTKFKLGNIYAQPLAITANLYEFSIEIGRVKVSSGGTTFATCPFPTSWENDTATNEYGMWSFDVTNGGYNDYPTKNALDQDDNTMWVRTGADATQDTILKVNLPQDAEIKPTRFKVVAARVNGGFSIEGYNGSGWTTLVTHAEEISSSKETIERQVSTNNYFTAFRLVFKHTETNNPAIYEFQVLSGEFRVGNIGGE